MLQTVVVLVPVVTLFLLLNSDFSGSTGAACRPRLSVSAVTVMRRRRGYHSAKAEPMFVLPRALAVRGSRARPGRTGR